MKHPIDLNFMKSLGNEKRLQIVLFLAQRTQASVNEISHSLGMAQSSASEHLKILKEAQVIQGQRDGNKIHYALNIPSITSKLDLISNYLKNCC